MERKILHIDVNNAFLSWTAIDRLKHGETLDLRMVPSIIGGDEEKRKGILWTKGTLRKRKEKRGGIFSEPALPRLNFPGKDDMILSGMPPGGTPG